MKKRVLSIILASIMVASNVEPVFADYSPSNQAADVEDQNVYIGDEDSSEELVIPYDDELEVVDEQAEIRGLSSEQPDIDTEGGLKKADIDKAMETSENPMGDDFIPGYIHDQHEEEYENVDENANRDTFFSVLEQKYISPMATQILSRDQNPYNTCWAFSTMSAAEMSAAQHGIKMTNGTTANKNIDLSELHLAYFCGNGLEKYDPLDGMNGDYNGVPGNDYLNSGGSTERAVKLLSSWTGAASESKYSYTSASSNYSINKVNALDDELHLRGYYVADPQEQRQEVKKLVKNYGAVATSYYNIRSTDIFDYKGKRFKLEDAYDGENVCYYMPLNVEDNHGVSIVGWDDNFSKYNFATQPEGDGAWLIRNSWTSGNSVDSNGRIIGQAAKYRSYFWMSYYDKTLNKCFALEMDPVDKYDHNYQYDGAIDTVGLRGTKFANIYTSKSNSEIVKAVYFSTSSADVNYTIDIYVGVSEGNPVSGEKVSTKTGTTRYGGGYTVDLDNPVYLSKGDKFSVVVSSSEGMFMDSECGRYANTVAYSEDGRSMYFTGKSWARNPIAGDFRIKAFTVDDSSSRYSITFIANEGQFASGSTTQTKKIPAGSKYGELPVPIRTGYDFDGWYTKAVGGNKISSSTTASASATYYAHWTAKTYTLTFNANGGKINGSTTQTKQVNYGETYGTLPVPTRDGYSFNGWYTTSSSTGGDQITAQTTHLQESDRTVYARWSSTAITVTLDPKGGRCDKSTINVTYGSAYGTLPTPTKTGYSFMGWYTATTGGSKVTSTTTVSNTKAHTLYAQWTVKTYNLIFNANGGEINGSTTQTKQVNYGEAYGTLPVPTRDGYSFSGWYTTSSAGGEQITAQTKHTLDSDRTVYARWSSVDIYVLLDLNGGECDKYYITVSYGSTYGTLPTPTRTGYDFVGWFTEKRSGTKVTNSTIVDSTKTHTLYAHWNPITCTVRFVANGGECATTLKNVTYDSIYGDLPTPFFEGHQFVGWFLENTFETVINPSTIVKTYTNHTLYAKWVIGKHIVTFDLNGVDGEAPLPQEIDDGNTAYKPSDPKMKKLEFTGWYVDKECRSEFDFGTPVKQDMTLYAGWKEEEKYTIVYDPNGADGVTPVDKTEYNKGDQVKIMYSDMLSKDGFFFAGWCEDPKGTGNVYFPGNIVEINKNMVLYALWQEKNELQQWGFSNSREYFGNSSEGYQVNKDDYSKLVSNLNRVERARVEKALKEIWNGSCYGMSTSVALINKNTGSISDFNLGSNVKTLNDVKAADESYYMGYGDSIGAAESVINFYNVQQHLPSSQRLIYDFEGYNNVERMEILSKLAKNASKDNPFVIFMFWKVENRELGHAVLGTGYRELSSEEKHYNDFPHCITIYDPSLPVEFAQNSNISNIYFNDAGEWYNEGFGISPENEDLICATDDLSLVAPVDYRTGNYNHRFAAPVEITYRGDCQIEWDNNSVVLNGRDVLKNTSSDQIMALPEMINGDYADRYGVFVPISDSYKISSQILDHELITDDRLISVKSPSGGTAILDSWGGGQMTSATAGNMSFEIVDNHASGSIPAHILIETGKATKLSEKVGEGGIIVDSDDLSGLTVTTDTESEKYNLTEDRVLIKEENGELKLYVDKDKDGSFESEVKKGEEEEEEEEEEKKDKTYTIVAGQKINLRQTCFADVKDTIIQYSVNNKSLASVSKETLTGKKPGKVMVYAQKRNEYYQYETIEREITILNKPKLKFTKTMTYIGQTLNGSDFFLTEDIRTNGATYWESNKPGIIEVTDSSKGILQAKGNGTAKITAYFGERGMPGTLKISANLSVKAPSFAKTDYSLQTGAKLTISMKNVNGALDPEWVTAEVGKARATAQLNGKGVKTGKVIVEGLSYGDTKLTATIDGQEYYCTIHVTAPEINKRAMALKIGKTGTVSLKKTKLKKADVKWETDTPSVAVVDVNGKITALSPGTAIIYTETGGIRNECYVTVR